MPEATTSPKMRPSTAPRSRSWRCSSCNVSVSFAAGHAPVQPDGWVESNRWVGLRCHRELVMCPRRLGPVADGWASRREALMEFELLRAPGCSWTVVMAEAHQLLDRSRAQGAPGPEGLGQAAEAPPSAPRNSS